MTVRSRGRWAALAGLAAVALLAACTSSKGKPPAPGTSPVAPPSCATSPCSTAGAVRWSSALGSPLGVTLGSTPTATNAQTVTYHDAAGDPLVSASVAGVTALAWGTTVRGFDTTSGASRWTATALVPAGQLVVAAHAVTPFLAVTVAAAAAARAYTADATGAGTGPATELLINPATGALVARLPTVLSQGAIWSDGRSVIVYEPGHLVRAEVAGGAPLWTVAADPGSVAVAGGVVVLGSNGVGGNRLAGYSVSDGHAVALPTLPGAVVAGVLGNAVVIDGPAAAFAPGQATATWTGGADTDVHGLDASAQTLYVGTGPSNAASGPVSAVALGSTARSTATKLMTTEPAGRLSAVVDGTAVYLGPDEVDEVVTGLDPPTGGTRWQSVALTNFDNLSRAAAPVPGLVGAAFVVGVTCAGSALTGATCSDPHLTVLNT